LTNGVAFGTTELHVLRSSPTLDARFLFYLTIAHDFRSHGESEMLGAGGQKRVPESFLKDWMPPLPRIDVQQRIARFLDEKIACIDALIEKKQALLERLAEKRQALISCAVTKGLNPDAPMKPSGVNWLGDIPSHWELWKLAHAYTRIGSGTTPTSGSDEYYQADGGTPWVTTSELREKCIRETNANVTDRALVDFPALQVYRPGSVFIAMYGATIGRLGISEVAAACNQACCVFEDSEQLSNKFLFYWILHRRGELVALAVGGGQPNLSQQDLRNELVAFPPMDEQREIVDLLDQRVGEMVAHLRGSDDLGSTLRPWAGNFGNKSISKPSSRLVLRGTDNCAAFIRRGLGCASSTAPHRMERGSMRPIPHRQLEKRYDEQRREGHQGREGTTRAADRYRHRPWGEGTGWAGRFGRGFHTRGRRARTAG
ncbi:MAG TPA: restriction endonuclease subunit S, partial [Pseudoxanthomonas sp.]|nr:restriction endonuclease subunit S [Pseudoxanthomonas sp.]